MYYRLQVPVFFSCCYLMLVVGCEKLGVFSMCLLYLHLQASLFAFPMGVGWGSAGKGCLHASLPQWLTTAAYYLVLDSLLRLGWSFVLIQPKF